jgi:hypothetical protein
MDLNGARMDPLYRQLLQTDFYSFRSALDDRLNAVGVESYHLIRSGPEGKAGDTCEAGGRKNRRHNRTPVRLFYERAIGVALPSGP